jgi:hypothetical protein
MKKQVKIDWYNKFEKLFEELQEIDESNRQIIYSFCYNTKRKNNRK